jgi:hypothetical protein
VAGDLGAVAGDLGAVAGDLGAVAGDLGAVAGDLGAVAGDLGALDPPPRQTETPICVVQHWHIVVMPSLDSSCNKYYIGLVLEAFDSDNDLIMSIDLLLDSSAMFFQFPIESAKRLMVVYAEDEEESALFAEDMCILLGLHDHSLENVYDLPICNKTYWIRIIQRKWKTVYRRRMELLRRRGEMAAQRRFELTGNYGLGYSVDCSLSGMLRPLLFQGKKIQELVDVGQNLVADIQEVGVSL